MARRLKRTRRVQSPPANNAQEMLLRDYPRMTSSEKERLAYVAGLPTDLFDFESGAKLEAFEDANNYVDEAKANIVPDEDWLSDEIGNLRSFAETIRNKERRKELMEIAQAFEDRRDEAVRSGEVALEELDRLDKAISTLLN